MASQRAEQSQTQQQTPENRSRLMTLSMAAEQNLTSDKDFQEAFGGKLSINPHLTDFSQQQFLDTPSSFKGSLVNHANTNNKAKNVTVNPHLPQTHSQAPGPATTKAAQSLAQLKQQSINGININGNVFGPSTAPNPNLSFNYFSGTGNTPTTPFGLGLSQLQFPSMSSASAMNGPYTSVGLGLKDNSQMQHGGNNITIANFQHINASIVSPTVNTPSFGFGMNMMTPNADISSEDLLNFLPRTPNVGFNRGFNFIPQFFAQQSQSSPLGISNSLLANTQQQGQSGLGKGFAALSNQEAFNQRNIKRESVHTGKNREDDEDYEDPEAEDGDSVSENSTKPNRKSKTSNQKPLKRASSARSQTERRGSLMNNSLKKRGRDVDTGSPATVAEKCKDESRWKSWTREEEVFLVGAVMDRFFKRGSLSSTRADDLAADDSWSVIKLYYETAWRNFELRTGNRIPTDRPANALSRHYKVMKARISQADISGSSTEDFRTYFDEWEHVYNVNNCLVRELLDARVLGTALQSMSDGDFKKRKKRASVLKRKGRNSRDVPSPVDLDEDDADYA